MKFLWGLLILGALAACGVDGAPERPKSDGPTGISITGEAPAGIAGGSN